MAITRLLVGTLLLLLLQFGIRISASTTDHQNCRSALEAWSADALMQEEDVPNGTFQEVKRLIFFLHVPRTGGRTYSNCLLRNLFPKSERCAYSYDVLRYNDSKSCRILVSHDDYSVLKKLPRDQTSVITTIRDPVERVVSAYEFAIAAASRGRFEGRISSTKADHINGSGTNNTFAAHRPAEPSIDASKLLERQNTSLLSTPGAAKPPGQSKIWPWTYLFPWMKEDILQRQEARDKINEPTPIPKDFLHYNANTYIIPLHEFIHEPIVKDLLHNGATFQVAGLTNNSYMKEAKYLRSCVINHSNLGHYVLEVAKRRLDKMTYVGLTEKHKESATLFAHMIGQQIIPLGDPNNVNKYDNITNHEAQGYLFDSSYHPLISNSTIRGSNNGTIHVERYGNINHMNLTVHKLIQFFERCAPLVHQKQKRNVQDAFTRITHVNFSLEERQFIPKGTLQAIRKLNYLDIELLEYARLLFTQEHLKHMASNNESHVLIDGSIIYKWCSAHYNISRLMILLIALMAFGGSMATLSIYSPHKRKLQHIQHKKM